MFSGTAEVCGKPLIGDHLVSLVVGRHEFETPFDPVSMCVMEMFDEATFAQVPLRLTGDPAHPVEARRRRRLQGGHLAALAAGQEGARVLRVPMRFSAGEPFQAGMAWQLMDVGLKGMGGVLAD